MKITPAKVIMQIVYSEDEVSEELIDYKKKLESYGAVVFLVKTGNDIKCVLKSQIIRILAYLFPFVKSNDIIVTADVDAFIMTPEIYKPLMLINRKIWLYRYAFTLGSGSTFMMPFIGAKAHVWREMLEYDATEDDLNQGILGNNIPKMIKTYSKKMNFSENNTWEKISILSVMESLAVATVPYQFQTIYGKSLDYNQIFLMTLKRVGMVVEYMKIVIMCSGREIYLYVTKERIVNGGIFIHMKHMQN